MRRGRGKEKASGPPCLSRLQKDLDDLQYLKDECQLRFPNVNDIQHFILRIKIFQGIYRNHKFDFSFDIPDDWPFTQPTVKILTKCWHPNLTLEGDVCLNILRNNYVPTLTLQTYVPSLQFLFNEPNPTDPLNKEAAAQYSQNFPAFKLKAEEFMEQYCPKD